MLSSDKQCLSESTMINQMSIGDKKSSMYEIGGVFTDTFLISQTLDTILDSGF